MPIGCIPISRLRRASPKSPYLGLSPNPLAWRSILDLVRFFVGRLRALITRVETRGACAVLRAT